jgi:predicted DNA-binding transcriptional regulator AlpA
MTSTTKALLQSLVSNDPSLSARERYGFEALINGAEREKLRIITEEASEPLLLTQKEAARVLGVSRVTLWRLKKEGVLKPVELTPGNYRYQRREIEAFSRLGLRQRTQDLGRE